MARRTNGGRFLVFGMALALGAVLVAQGASASSRHSGYGVRHESVRASRLSRHAHARLGAHRAYAGGLQCVPFARNVSGIDIGGNAWTWWDQASGVYERGARPESGSVLSFAANGRMRLGHVAVVSDVIGAREIAIDHANWSGHGGVNREMRVVDVSEANDWTAVRLEMGNGEFGSIYPTHGFIYDRPDHGTMVAAAAAAPAPELNPAPADLRGRDRGDDADVEEVAEVSEHGRRYHTHAHSHSRAFAHHQHNRRLALL